MIISIISRGSVVAGDRHIAEFPGEASLERTFQSLAGVARVRY